MNMYKPVRKADGKLCDNQIYRIYEIFAISFNSTPAIKHNSTHSSPQNGEWYIVVTYFVVLCVSMLRLHKANQTYAYTLSLWKLDLYVSFHCFASSHHD